MPQEPRERSTPDPPPPRPLGRAARRFAAAVAVVAALSGVYSWHIQPPLLVPFDPAELEAVGEPGPHRVFAYATLRSPVVRFVVTGRARPGRAATLPGYRRFGRDVLPDPDSEVEGLVVVVTTRELRRLDRYERVGLRYERVALTLDDGRPAWVYQMLPPPTAAAMDTPADAAGATGEAGSAAGETAGDAR